jgi:hypothetical protein
LKLANAVDVTLAEPFSPERAGANSASIDVDEGKIDDRLRSFRQTALPSDSPSRR